jgi:hypothetical protein
MTIKDLAKEINTHRQILKGYEDALYISNLEELCNRLRQTCRGIVETNYRWIEGPRGWYAHRCIADMPISDIMNKARPIIDIVWSVDENKVSALITVTNAKPITVSFPTDNISFECFIRLYDIQSKERKAKELEEQKMYIAISKNRENPSSDYVRSIYNLINEEF